MFFFFRFSVNDNFYELQYGFIQNNSFSSTYTIRFLSVLRRLQDANQRWLTHPVSGIYMMAKNSITAWEKHLLYCLIQFAWAYNTSKLDHVKFLKKISVFSRSLAEVLMTWLFIFVGIVQIFSSKSEPRQTRYKVHTHISMYILLVP